MEAVGGGYLCSSHTLSTQQRFKPQIHTVDAHGSHTLGMSLLRLCCVSRHVSASFAAKQPAFEGLM